MIKKITHLLTFLKDDLHKMKHSDVLFFCHDNDRGIDFNGVAYSPIIDSYSEELQRQGLTVQTIAHPWSKLTGRLAFGCPLSFNRSYFFARLLDKKFKTHKTKKLYLKIFKKTNPKKIITIGCNDAFCQAARELNILHIEILHGFGYAPIPWGWDKKEKENLPQEIYSFDMVSTETFKGLSKHDVKITQTQHPFLKRFDKSELHKLPLEWQVAPRAEFKKQILISLQWGYASGVDCHPEFEGVLENGLFPTGLLNIISKTEKEVLWRFRFHPVHYRNQDKYQAHFKLIERLVSKYKNCEWQESTYKPLPSVLAYCDGHLTMSSMSSYEAAYMGIKTIAYCPTLRDGKVNHKLFNDLEMSNKLMKNKFSIQDLNSLFHLKINI